MTCLIQKMFFTTPPNISMKHGTKELWPHVYRVPWIIIYHPSSQHFLLVLPCSNIAQQTQSFWLYIKSLGDQYLRSIVSLDMAVRTSLRIASYKYSVLPGYKLWFHGEFQSSLRAGKKQSKMIGKPKKDRSLRFVCITWRVSKGFTGEQRLQGNPNLLRFFQHVSWDPFVS